MLDCKDCAQAGFSECHCKLPTGRPPKPPAEKYRQFNLKLPPALLAELREKVPVGKRSEFIVNAVSAALRNVAEPEDGE